MRTKKIRHSKLDSSARKPPARLRARLRAEVGFGCPICGSPYLEYHHFDPPWHEGKIHNPAGMIALCGRHHGEADNGVYTDKQLRSLKTAKHEIVKGRFNWQRRHTIFFCGGVIAYNCRSMISVAGSPIVYFEKDVDGFDTLSLRIFDNDMNAVFMMTKNDWELRNGIDEFEAGPKKQILSLRSKDSAIIMKLEYKDFSQFNQLERQQVEYFGISEDEGIMACSVTGRLQSPEPVIFDHKFVQIGENQRIGGRMSNCLSAIAIE